MDWGVKWKFGLCWQTLNDFTIFFRRMTKLHWYPSMLHRPCQTEKYLQWQYWRRIWGPSWPRATRLWLRLWRTRRLGEDVGGRWDTSNYSTPCSSSATVRQSFITNEFIQSILFQSFILLSLVYITHLTLMQSLLLLLLLKMMMIS